MMVNNSIPSGNLLQFAMEHHHFQWVHPCKSTISMISMAMFNSKL